MENGRGRNQLEANIIEARKLNVKLQYSCGSELEAMVMMEKTLSVQIRCLFGLVIGQNSIKSECFYHVNVFCFDK